MLDFVSKGGPLMWILLVCSILLIAVVAERLVYLHRATIHVAEFLQGLSNLVRRKAFAESLNEVTSTQGPVARVVRAALVNHDKSRADLKSIVQEAGQLEVPKLERYLYVIGTVAYAAPLIGFLGTATGLLDSFMRLTSSSGYATAMDLSGGIYQSLITTSAGLGIGIAAFVAHNYVSARINSVLHDMERAGIEMVQLICDEASRSSIVAFEQPAVSPKAEKAR
jgi:biopolymer transport protein ExbB